MYPWKRKWQPTSVFLPGTSHGLRSWSGGGRQREGPTVHEIAESQIRVSTHSQLLYNKVPVSYSVT